jgi:hypothetical protein
MNAKNNGVIRASQTSATSRSIRGSSSTRRQKSARIEISGGVAVAEPIELKVAELLCYYERIFEEGGPHGITIGSTKRRAFGVYERGMLRFPAGLASRVRAAYERLGYRVEIVDTTEPRPGVALDAMAKDGLGRDELRFARTLAQERRGLIVAPRLDQRVALVACAVRAFLLPRIMVACLTRRQAGQFRVRLQALLNEPVPVHNQGGYVICESRVQVTTWASLREYTCGIIFFANASDAVTGEYIHTAWKYRNVHLYGFASPDEGLGVDKRLMVEGVFGDVVYEVESHGRRPAGVQVHLADAPDVDVPRHATALERKRCYWHADRRNATIAAIARAFASGRLDDLVCHGLFLNGEALASIADGQTQRVAVLVESPEHARALADLLPGWRVLDARHDRHAYSVSDNRKGLAAKHKFENADGAIVTLVRAHEIKELDVDVVIRGDANSWPLDLPCFPPLARRGDARQALLVDLGDEGDDTAIAATRTRLDDYEARGWVVEAPDRWRRGPELDEVAIAKWLTKQGRRQVRLE